MLSGFLLFAFPFCMVFASFSDLVSMTISNKVPAALCAGFAVAAVTLGLSPAAIGLHVVVALACLVLTFGCFAAGWMGGGDAKLVAATALWFGPSALLMEYVLMSAVYGGVLTLGLLCARRMIPVCGIDFLDRLLHPETGIPYGIALGAAGLSVYSGSFWMDGAVAGLAG